MPCRFFGSITIAFICCRAWDCLPTQESYLQNKTPIIGVWRRAIDYGKHSLSVYHNLYIWLSSSLCLEEVIEMITVLSDCYYCCTSPMCLCREPRDAFKFIKYFCFRTLHGRGHILLPHPPPRVSLQHALFRFFHHGAPPLSFSGSAPGSCVKQVNHGSRPS